MVYTKDWMLKWVLWWLARQTVYSGYCSNTVYMNINTGNVAIEFIRYNSQLLVQHLYVSPWGLIDRFVGASQHNVKKRVHTSYCNLFHFANDIEHYKQKMNLYTAESDVFCRMFAKYFLCSLSIWNLIMNLLVKISYQFKCMTLSYCNAVYMCISFSFFLFPLSNALKDMIP